MTTRLDPDMNLPAFRPPQVTLSEHFNSIETLFLLSKMARRHKDGDSGQDKLQRRSHSLYHGTLFATYGLSVKSVLPTNYRSVKTFTDGPRTSLQAVSVKLLPTDRCFTDLSSVAKREVLPTLHHLVIIVLPTL